MQKPRTTRERSWVEASVWTERMVSALENGVKGGRWFSLIDKVYAPATLAVAWAKVRANERRGRCGWPEHRAVRSAGRRSIWLSCRRRCGRARYRPQPVKRVEIPKGDGRTRPLGIPAVKDRIVQTAMKLVIEPIFEATFGPSELRLPAGTRLP